MSLHNSIILVFSIGALLHEKKQKPIADITIILRTNSIAKIDYLEQIPSNIQRLKEQIGSKTNLIVVSKFRSIEEIQCAYDAGIRDFAENRVQALLERKTQLPADIRWHLIGTLQTNKVKYIIPFIHCIHSIDTEKLLIEVQKQAHKNNRIIPCLLQLHIAQEESKHGFSEMELMQFMDAFNPTNFPNILLTGLMAMSTNTENKVIIESEFSQSNKIFNHIKTNFEEKLPKWNELSIGMSNDYLIAINHGSTMVRIGSAVFN